MTKTSAARLAKVLLVILALGMPVSTLSAARTATPAAEVETPCGEPTAPNEAAETQAEESETMHAPSFDALAAAPGSAAFVHENPARRLGARGKPPHQPPNPA